MLSAADASALVGARHADPFAVLGLHADDDGALWLRAMLPGSTAVAVLDAVSGKRVVALSLRDEAGLWEAVIPRRRRRFDYRLQVQWDSGASGTYADAYAYGPLIADADLHFFGEGSHLRPFTMFGAHAVSVGKVDGVRFAVWAPNAKRVSVIGDFNAWDGRRHPMRSRGGGGVWEIFVPHVAFGERYKFELLGHDGTLLPPKADPYAFAAETRPSTASIVAPLPPARALPGDRAAANARHAPVSIYELHAGSWRRHPDGTLHSWDELAAALPAYVADLGFTH
ncbi:MAG TPA: 1,4-alpha-glucan branching enzyme, partial [Rubrivivax sp.]